MAEAVENFFVLEISSFKLSESFKSAAEGVLKIFEGVYVAGGGGGGQCAPLVGIGLNWVLRMLFIEA